MTERFCTVCGAPRRFAETLCVVCGNPFGEGAPSLGSSLPSAAAPHTRRRRWWPLAIAAAAAAVVGGVIVGMALADRPESSGDGVGDAERRVTPPALSGDRTRVAEEFGLPRTFSIVIGEDPESALEGGDLESHRIESWDYYELGTRFIFRDGAIVATNRLEPLDPWSFAYPAVAPMDFVEGMTVEDVSSMLGHEPGGSVEVAVGLDATVEVYVWSGVVSCTFSDGGLVAVETAPLYFEEGL